MKQLTESQYDQIQGVLPVQRGNAEMTNLDFLNAILYIAENGCKWRQLPEKFGIWNTIYVRMRRWADSGVWTRVLNALQSELNMLLDVMALSLDSSSIKVHPDGTGALKKTAPKPSEKVAVDATQKST